MPTLQDVAPSEWIKASQFKPNEQKTLTIKGWETTDFKDQKTGKSKLSLTLLFEETKSKLGIVNAANENSLSKIFGQGYDLDTLAGHKITLFTILVKQDDNGEPVYGIRIKAPANGNGHTASEHAPEVSRQALVDELMTVRAEIKKLSPDSLPAKPTPDQLAGEGLAAQLASHNLILEAVKLEVAA